MRQLTLTRNALIVLCGPAGSGKSYFAQKFFRPSEIVSSDYCREMIADDPTIQTVSPDAFELMIRIIEYRLKWNRLTVADATHLTPAYRKPLRELAAKHGRPIYLVLFETDLAGCRKHNAARTRRVEDHIIESQMEKFQRVKDQIAEENYEKVFVLHPDEIDALKVSFQKKESTNP